MEIKQHHAGVAGKKTIQPSTPGKQYRKVPLPPAKPTYQFGAPGNALVEEALTHAVETEIENVRTRVMTAEHLTAIALQTGRAKDFARILQFIESGALEADKLDTIFKRHGLIAKWEQFGDKFKGSL